MMKLPNFVRSVTNIAKQQPINKFFNLKPAAACASYSTLQRQNLLVNVNVNVNVNDNKDKNVKHPSESIKTNDAQAALLQNVIREQNKVNDLITSIQALQVNMIVDSNSSKVQKEQRGQTNMITLPDVVGILQALNRSARNPKRANRGKRPVCRTARRNKRRRWGNHKR
jgi:hypothetical protein